MFSHHQDCLVMRVFVTGTGRCGSVSFREACRYADNYRTGHETRCGLLEYPDWFIEVNPQLRCCIPTIIGKYPEAKWVHLVRRPEDCIPSLARLGHGSVMRAYESLHRSVMQTNDLSDIAFRYYWAENDTIEAVLNHMLPETQRLTMRLETIQEQWGYFWEWIGAVGNFEASCMAWDVKRNTGEERGEK